MKQMFGCFCLLLAADSLWELWNVDFSCCQNAAGEAVMFLIAPPPPHTTYFLMMCSECVLLCFLFALFTSPPPHPLTPPSSCSRPLLTPWRWNLSGFNWLVSIKSWKLTNSQGTVRLTLVQLVIFPSNFWTPPFTLGRGPDAFVGKSFFITCPSPPLSLLLPLF